MLVARALRGAASASSPDLGVGLVAPEGDAVRAKASALHCGGGRVQAKDGSGVGRRAGIVHPNRPLCDPIDGSHRLGYRTTARPLLRAVPHGHHLLVVIARLHCCPKWRDELARGGDAFIQLCIHLLLVLLPLSTGGAASDPMHKMASLFTTRCVSFRISTLQVELFFISIF
eukprot:scaffold287584_cov30-Tisochrysis_lutea.AAC.4